METQAQTSSHEEESELLENISEDESLLEAYEKSTDDAYNLNVSLAVLDEETDEIIGEFAEAVTEIEGKKSFPCSECAKVCKSKDGLTKHMNSKRQDIATSVNSPCLTMENLEGIVEAIKTKSVNDDLYGPDVNAAIEKISWSKGLFDAILPIYNLFCRKKNQDVLLEEFYGLLPINASTFLNCPENNVGNLIMIEIPDHLVGFYKISQVQEDAKKNPISTNSSSTKTIEISLHKRGPFSYIAGCIISKLYQTSRSRKGTCDGTLHALLQSLKSDQSANSFISARSRGGLVTLCDDLLGILEEAEKTFRKKGDLMGDLTDTVRNIPQDLICVSTLDSPVVKSLWENIVLNSGINPEESKWTQKLCQENIIKLYLRVRCFSYTRDYISKYKIKEKQTKGKALRKSLKQ